jgi:hypothetical protein
MFPKRGKFFPDRTGQMDQAESYVLVVAAELRRELGDTHQAVKTIMRWTGANERTVKNWLAGRCGPNGDHLISLFRYSSVVLDAVLRLAGHEQVVHAKKLVALRAALADALVQIDSSIGERSRPL